MTTGTAKFDWSKLDYTKLEQRVVATMGEVNRKFCEEYLYTWKDERQFLVKRRYDLHPANSPEIVDCTRLIPLVQPISAVGIAELNSIRVNQIAHTNMYTITRVN